MQIGPGEFTRANASKYEIQKGLGENLPGPFCLLLLLVQEENLLSLDLQLSAEGF